MLFFWVIGGEEELGLVGCFLFCFFFWVCWGGEDTEEGMKEEEGVEKGIGCCCCCC